MVFLLHAGSIFGFMTCEVQSYIKHSTLLVFNKQGGHLIRVEYKGEKSAKKSHQLFCLKWIIYFMVSFCDGQGMRALGGWKPYGRSVEHKKEQRRYPQIHSTSLKLLGENLLRKSGIVEWVAPGGLMVWFWDANLLLTVEDSLRRPLIEVAASAVHHTCIPPTLKFTKDKGYNIKPGD
ncbi:hypothetical protein F4604DRAFT_1688682 [Suillus subluteus]|nr:hypothetical protein F4604DRAFT_1688682 [Suillus subluteus]